MQRTLGAFARACGGRLHGADRSYSGVSTDTRTLLYAVARVVLLGRRGSLADQLERRIAYRRAMKRAIQQAMRQGAKGIKIMVGGRLGGAEMSRDVTLRDGRVPLQTLRANLDFAKTEASTTYGQLGVKVWVYKGEAVPETEEKAEATEGVYVSE